MILYVAGPMRGLPEFNFPAFDAAAEELRDAGYEVINPAEVDRALGIDPNRGEDFSQADYEAAMRRDIPMVMRSDGVALLQGWRTSKGATLEHDIARAIGLKAQSVNAWLFAAALSKVPR